jgi:glycosyltransferase involved in cell wall biosynthesis
MPKLTVIIPTHNRAGLLAGAVESVRQAGTDLEIIVVDNASTDNTSQVCASLPNIRYIRLDQNLGEGGARNVGIQESKSEYVAFLDDDDLRLPGSLDKQYEVLLQEPQAALVYGPVLIGDEDCRPTGEKYPASRPTGDVFWELLAFNFIPLPSVLARKQSLIEAGLFASGLQPARDYDLWLRVVEKFEVAAVDDPVAIYRRWTISGAQMSANLARQYAAGAAVQARGLSSRRARQASAATRRRVRQSLLKVISDSLLHEAVVALRRDDLRVALRNIATAMRFQPWSIARREHLRSFMFSSIEFVGRRRRRLLSN